LHVSVIATVLNERESLPTLLSSLAEQTRVPDEVIIVDGGSTDGTLAYLREQARLGRLPLVVLSAPGANISSGRNRAIAASKGDVIAATDAGVRLGADWLECLVRPFADAPRPDVVAGVFRSAPESLFERALGALTLPRLDELDSKTFLPSSRSVAFTRNAWSSVGGYPEWLDYCEDLVFDLALRRQGAVFALAQEAVAYFRPRQSLTAFAKQYYRYARGDGKADLWRLRHAVRYGTYLLAGPALVVLSAVHSAWWLVAFALGAVGMFSRPWRRLLPELRRARWQDALVMVVLLPVIVITGDVAKMLGYPVGLGWRWRHGRAIDRPCGV
jgi:glycosyltransferase involved in cell wall biosynthesis